MDKEYKIQNIQIHSRKDGAPIVYKNKCQYVVDEMLSLLASGKYNPGDRLPPEAYFIELFEVSRVTLRESFKMLDMLGVISIRQGEGTFVTKITLSNLFSSLYPLMVMERQNVEDLYDARISIEASIAEIAARKRTEKDLLHIRSLIKKMEACAEREDLEAYITLDEEFHQALATASHNTIMQAIYMVFADVRKRGFIFSNSSVSAMKHSLNKHQELYDALEMQNEKIIGAVLIQHLNFSKKAAQQYLGEKN